MSTEVLLVVMTLVTYRTAKLLTEDEFPPLLWLRKKLTDPYATSPDDPVRRTTRVPYWLAYLWTCMWCMPVWTSAVVTGLTALTIGVPAPFLVWLAIAAGASLISHVEEFLTR